MRLSFIADLRGPLPGRWSLVAITLLLGLSGCLSQVEGEEVGATAEGLTAAQRRERAGDIRDAAAARGLTQGWLFAGIADAETTMSHCWSELTWACQGPTSPDCGGGPIVAGAADGPCSDRQGGLGMFQFDAGTYDQTLAREGERILTISGNTDAAVDFVIDMVIRSDFVAGVSTASEAIAWMNGVSRTDDVALDAWASTVTRYYNGCPTTGSCWSERFARYRRIASSVHDEMGATFWGETTGGGGSGGGGSGGGGDGGGTGGTGGTMTGVAHSGAFVDQSFPAAGEPFTLAPGEERYGYFELRNTGTDTWAPGFTFLGTVLPRDGESALYGPDWTAPHRAASVERSVAPGEVARFGFTVRAPLVPGEYRQAFNLVEEGVGFFADVGVAPSDMEISVMVTDVGSGGGTGGSDPGGEPLPGSDPTPGEGGAGHPGSGGVVGGCSASGGSGSTALAPFLVALGLVSRRRRRR
jgi:uncharacterized protein (TIGR03382 family)